MLRDQPIPILSRPTLLAKACSIRDTDKGERRS
jgi:hypothetical protein